jgi:hypothetical protein
MDRVRGGFGMIIRRVGFGMGYIRGIELDITCMGEMNYCMLHLSVERSPDNRLSCN